MELQAESLGFNQLLNTHPEAHQYVARKQKEIDEKIAKLLE